jgi:thiol-disulfide isomerase/thioredoxin
LLDIAGNKVSFDDYRGKIIIIDFWATWCGPCLAPFPGMKKAVVKYENDSWVKFLFINTWERVEEKTKNAADFILKNDYPFHVLVDDENKVIEKYKVSGIPTKFIIDSEGNIRFKSIGFAGSDDKLVEELSTMISLIK